MSRTRYRQPDYGQQRYASMCVTQVGACQLMVPMSTGEGCVCYTQWGQIRGYTQ